MTHSKPVKTGGFWAATNRKTTAKTLLDVSDKLEKATKSLATNPYALRNATAFQELEAADFMLLQLVHDLTITDHSECCPNRFPPTAKAVGIQRGKIL